MSDYLSLFETALTEIEIGGYLGDDDFLGKMHTKDLSSDQLDLFSDVPSGEPKMPEGYKVVGRMGRYYVVHAVNEADACYIWVLDGKAAAWIGMVEYVAENLDYYQDIVHKPNLEGYGLRVAAIFVREQYRGDNLALQMYKWVLKNGVCDYLMADSKQTHAGAALWKRLRRDPELYVSVWDSNDQYSHERKRNRDFDRVYRTAHLLPWVCLKSRAAQVEHGTDEED